VSGEWRDSRGKEQGKMSDADGDLQDPEHGGIADRPGDMVDVFHTQFGIAGLSLLEYPGLEQVDPT
jgi:hypothetical protein